jgi:hypothetical protein
MAEKVLVAVTTMRHWFSLCVACLVTCSSSVGKRGWLHKWTGGAQVPSHNCNGEKLKVWPSLFFYNRSSLYWLYLAMSGNLDFL